MRVVTVRLLLVLCLLAGTAQGFIARTHLHSRPGAVAAAGAVAVVDSAGREEPLCVLCDIASQTPAVAPPPALPTLVAASVASDGRRIAAAAVPVSHASHHWRGRAPPIA